MRRTQRLGGVQTASLQVYPYALSAQVRPGPHGAPVSVRLSPTTGTFHAAGCVGGVIRRRRGQQPRPPTRHLPPAAQKCPRTRRMSPAAAPECGASVASRATGAPTTPAPTSNHEFRAPHRRQKRPSRGRHGTPRDARVRQTLVTIPHRSGVSSPLSQQPGTLGEDRQVHPVAGTDPLLRTAQVSLDG